MKTNLFLELMREEDLDRVLEIERNSFSLPWSKEAFLQELQNPYALYFSAFWGEELVAYIGGWIVLDELHITNLAVAANYRRKGLASKLLEEIMKRARAKGVRRATLEVRVSNWGAIQLYQKSGFVAAGKRPGYYRDNHEDALIMWKEL